jgi:hypothetical protein
MAEDAPNRKWFLYIDNHGTSWNKMGQIDTGCNALDGNAAAVAGTQNFPRQSRRYRARAARFIDPATFRTKTCVIYTQAAETALSGSSTVSVNVPGTATPVTYTFDSLIPEKTPTKSISRNLAD